MVDGAKTQLAGRSLYEIVEDYAAFGNHWTGTEADFATTNWLVELLGELDASPLREPWSFDQFVGTAGVTSSGRNDVVPAVPVWYSATGHYETHRVEVRRLDGDVAGSATGIDDALADIAATGAEAAVLAVDGPDDLPVQCNRAPSTTGVLPAAIVPGNWFAPLAEQGATLTFAGSLRPGRSANVHGTFGPVDAPLVRVVTPLTGWTPAAGERGTGLAVALALASELAATHRVEFLAAAGHEIDHVGLRHHLSQRDPDGETVIHLGASVAATCEGDDGSAQLDPRRIVLTTAKGAVRAAIDDAVQPANLKVVNLEAPWPGEGGTWLAAGASVLSFLGRSTYFHVVDDLADRATTAEALAIAADAVSTATRLFINRDQAQLKQEVLYPD